MLSQAIFRSIRPKDVPELRLRILPRGRYLNTSLPRVNVLSLYAGKWKAIPALEREARKRKLRPAYRLEIYDKRIRYLVPAQGRK